MKKILEVYYPIIIAFICMMYSIILGLSEILLKLNIQHIGLEQFYCLQLQYAKEEKILTKKIINMLSPLMFIIGFIIFSLYMSGLLWMIKKSHDDQRKRRESDMRNVDDNDYDGGGNWGRFDNK